MEDENKRTVRRSRVFKIGKIVSMDYGLVISCQIRDITPIGAKIRCANIASVPDAFQLLINSDNTIRDVKVVWRQQDHVGVQFTSEARRAPPREW